MLFRPVSSSDELPRENLANGRSPKSIGSTWTRLMTSRAFAVEAELDLAFTRLLQSGHRRLTARTDDEPVRLLSSLAALVVALSLAGTATAASRELTIDRGVVQSISSTRIVLRELDGSTIAIAAGLRTRVLLNGLPAALSDIRPGYVAAVSHDGSAPARMIRAFGRVQSTTHRGVVVSVAARAFVIRTADGATLMLRLTARTRIRWRGLPARIAAIQPGRVVEVTVTPRGEAIRVVVHGRRAV